MAISTVIIAGRRYPFPSDPEQAIRLLMNGLEDHTQAIAELKKQQSPSPSSAAGGVATSTVREVGPSSIAWMVNFWLDSYDANTGAFSASQPAFSNISGVAGLAQGGTGVDLSASGGATEFLAQDAGHVISARVLIAADIPNLDAAKITTGQLALDRGGTAADLSATGGTSRVLKQSTVGGAVTVGQLAASDLSNGVSGTGAVVLTS